MVIFLDNPAGEGEAQSPPTFFCGIAGSEYIIFFAELYTFTGIRYIDKKGIAANRMMDMDIDGPFESFNRFISVLNKILHYPLE